MNTQTETDKFPYMAEVELTYKASPERTRWSICCPEDAYGMLMDIFPDGRLDLKEIFYLVLLDNSKNCLGFSKISEGGKTATIVDVSEVAVTALLGNANSVVLAHNHPSCHKKFSTADIQLTKRIKEALKILGIALDDHILVTRDGFVSMRNRGLM
ncbi:MAG: JAB domain-containing protein [Gracilimonas sp.]|uniref:JAB domain-containing protein n=1 Tax=Gracilimonas sp. TaxID=1974203 RepID=UPI0019BC7809|nr:JAB domain-containing protein [Gracilimonas sp.]MBD3617443.1 JAB domain-containing protein [Gracilimonas sp.]